MALMTQSPESLKFLQAASDIAGVDFLKASSVRFRLEVEVGNVTWNAHPTEAGLLGGSEILTFEQGRDIYEHACSAFEIPPLCTSMDIRFDASSAVQVTASFIASPRA